MGLFKLLKNIMIYSIVWIVLMIFFTLIIKNLETSFLITTIIVLGIMFLTSERHQEASKKRNERLAELRKIREEEYEKERAREEAREDSKRSYDYHW